MKVIRLERIMSMAIEWKEQILRGCWRRILGVRCLNLVNMQKRNLPSKFILSSGHDDLYWRILYCLQDFLCENPHNRSISNSYLPPFSTAGTISKREFAWSSADEIMVWEWYRIVT